MKYNINIFISLLYTSTYFPIYFHLNTGFYLFRNLFSFSFHKKNNIKFMQQVEANEAGRPNEVLITINSRVDLVILIHSIYQHVSTLWSRNL